MKRRTVLLLGIVVVAVLATFILFCSPGETIQTVAYQDLDETYLTDFRNAYQLYDTPYSYGDATLRKYDTLWGTKVVELYLPFYGVDICDMPCNITVDWAIDCGVFYLRYENGILTANEMQTVNWAQVTVTVDDNGAITRTSPPKPNQRGFTLQGTDVSCENGFIATFEKVKPHKLLFSVRSIESLIPPTDCFLQNDFQVRYPISGGLFREAEFSMDLAIPYVNNLDYDMD